MIAQLAELPGMAVHFDIFFAGVFDHLPFMGGMTAWVQTNRRADFALPANQANGKISVFVLVAHAVPLAAIDFDSIYVYEFIITFKYYLRQPEPR